MVSSVWSFLLTNVYHASWNLLARITDHFSAAATNDQSVSGPSKFSLQ